MKKFLLLMIFAISIGSSFGAEAEKDTCRRLVMFGTSAGGMAEVCKFKEGNGENLKELYAEQNCNSVLTPNEIRGVIEETSNDLNREIKSMGVTNWCKKHRENYLFLVAEDKKESGGSRAADIPSFRPGQNYSTVRKTLIQNGWSPLHLRDADVCVDGDARCQQRPEMFSCSGAGEANCKFLWKKGQSVMGICTVDSPARFSNICASD